MDTRMPEMDGFQAARVVPEDLPYHNADSVAFCDRFAGGSGRGAGSGYERYAFEAVRA